MIEENTVTIEFTLPRRREAREPPEVRGERRDSVRLLVSRRHSGTITHHTFTDLATVLLPGDLVVVNTSATLPAAVRASADISVHFSTPLPDGAWMIELREVRSSGTAPYARGAAGTVIDLPGGARLTLCCRMTGRLWRAQLSTSVIPYLLRHGRPIRYSYVTRDWPLEVYQTVFATRPGSAEMPSASRPFSAELVTRLVTSGVIIAPLRLDTGVSSLEGDEPPYPEPYEVPPATARLVNLTRRSGGRVIAAGTTVVRALETAAVAAGRDSPGAGGVIASAGWTDLVISPRRGPHVADGVLTGFHEPRSSHLLMLEAFAGPQLLRRCYAAALEQGYLWHEFGDVHLLLP
jgi:S-adenosylmethionine:tRNA ribosyltransferase-isomerase